MCVDIISALFVPIPEKKITIKSTKRERVHRNKKKIKTKNGKKKHSLFRHVLSVTFARGYLSFP